MFGFIGSWLWYKLSLNLVGAWYLIREQVTWSRLSWGNPPKKVVFDGQAFAGGGGHRSKPECKQISTFFPLEYDSLMHKTHFIVRGLKNFLC